MAVQLLSSVDTVPVGAFRSVTIASQEMKRYVSTVSGSRVSHTPHEQTCTHYVNTLTHTLTHTQLSDESEEEASSYASVSVSEDEDHVGQVYSFRDRERQDDEDDMEVRR